eukprot:3082751-Pleurochrysis_carterae.AAC.1
MAAAHPIASAATPEGLADFDALQTALKALQYARPVGLALFGCSNRKSGVTPEAERSRIDAPTRGVVNI